VGASSFTIQEAQEAGLLGKDNWKKYPSDMLFARAISRGAKRFAPGIFGGTAVYTADEMGVDHDEDGVIEPSFKITSQTVDAVEIKNRRMIESEERHNEMQSPLRGSDEAIIEEFKKTHVLSEGGF
jgi:hypothetical protein